MKYTIFDIEANGLLDKGTLIHCLSYAIYENKTLLAKGSFTDYTDISNFILQQETIVGHKIIEYDVPMLEKILDIKIDATLIDTLAISFYLYPIKGFVHGLAAWGERMGFPKPVIDDWDDLPVEVYVDRCESDVEINARTFHSMMDYLMQIYGDFNEIMRLIGYLGYKMDCLREQEDEKIKLDIRLAEQSSLDLEFIIDEKISNLAKFMPRIVDKTPPAIIYKKDGDLSVHGQSWFDLLKKKGLPENTQEITVPGSPTSPQQLKDWLFQLGWEPKTFKVNKKNKKIPQVSLPFGGGLCFSIREMFEKYPFLEELGGLYRARHRYGLFKSFLESVDDNGYIYSRAQGFTNTLRLQHAKPIANLPGVDKYYGKEIRGCLMVPDTTYIMCGSDISGLEDNTKQHYIYFYDPDYVTEMRVPGFDPHIDIAVLAELITKEDEEFYKKISAEKDSLGDNFVYGSEADANRYNVINTERKKAKLINFSATYGAGPPKIAESLKCTLKFAKKLHTTYWKRNAAVKQTAKDCRVKIVDKQKWLYNPVSGFWMFLKADKDRFSTLNQSTGVYVFDSWVRKVRQGLNELGIKISLQYHDEILLKCKQQHKFQVAVILKRAMDEMNAETGLNVTIGCSVDWGNNYAECH